MGWLAGKAARDQLESYASFADFRGSWYGIARYWRKKAE